jgi:anti-anti-sigma factor
MLGTLVARQCTTTASQEGIMTVSGSLSVRTTGGATGASHGQHAPNTLLCLRGDHDRTTVEPLWATISGAIDLADADLVLDLSDVAFMDASTLSVIIRAQQLLALRSRALAVRAPSPCALRLLDICGLTALLTPSVALAGGCADGAPRELS